MFLSTHQKSNFCFNKRTFKKSNFSFNFEQLFLHVTILFSAFFVTHIKLLFGKTQMIFSVHAIIQVVYTKHQKVWKVPEGWLAVKLWSNHSEEVPSPDVSDELLNFSDFLLHWLIYCWYKSGTLSFGRGRKVKFSRCC